MCVYLFSTTIAGVSFIIIYEVSCISEFFGEFVFGSDGVDYDVE